MKASVAIKHCVERRGLLDDMLVALGGAPVRVYTDVHKHGTWTTTRRCLAGMPSWATHVIVLDDDLLLCKDFLGGAVRAASQRPECVVSFWAKNPHVDKKASSGDRWVSVDYVQGPAVCFPRAVAEGLLIYAGHVEQGADDAHVTDYCKKHGVARWTTMPSLVEHLCPNDSLVQNRKADRSHRVASRFIGAEVSALSIDWSVA